MGHDIRLSLPSFLEQTVSKYADRPAVSFVGEKTISYSELQTQVNAFVAFLEKLNVKKGDKVALWSANMPQWGVVYLATCSMGAVLVPLLPDFSPNEIENILNHSEAETIVVSKGLSSKLAEVKVPQLKNRIAIEEFKLLNEEPDCATYSIEDVVKKKYNVEEDDLAAIFYTSGTTGKSKGVMLSHKNICSNAISSNDVQPISEKDRFLSILPLSHTYENTIGFVLPVYCGASVHYLRKAPTPAILLPALKQVKPTIMLSVPLIMDKIYRNKIKKNFEKNAVLRSMYSLAPTRKLLNRLAGKKLMETFGGEIHFFGIGGAKLDREVERFLLEAKFPYAIGYGLTEAAPLIAGANPRQTRLQSTGPSILNVELKINDPDPKTGRGEVWAKGPNVMQGYYKDEQATREVLTDSGWLRTGDVGKFDKKGNLFLDGRLKNVIIGASGENIYPEEIESLINNFRHVVESIVIEKKGKLVALVHFNREELEAKFNHLREEISQHVEKHIDELADELHEYVNARVNKFSRIQLVVTHNDPFHKTATQKIKRFIYA